VDTQLSAQPLVYAWHGTSRPLGATPRASGNPEPCAKARATQRACCVRHPNGEGEGPSLPGWARSHKGDRRGARAPGAGAAAPAAWPSSPSWARSHQWQDRRTAEATGAGAEAPAACESARPPPGGGVSWGDIPVMSAQGQGLKHGRTMAQCVVSRRDSRAVKIPLGDQNSAMGLPRPRRGTMSKAQLERDIGRRSSPPSQMPDAEAHARKRAPHSMGRRGAGCHASPGSASGAARRRSAFGEVVTTAKA